MNDLAPAALKILEIIWLNVILSGDNAVVIAMACRGLPVTQRRTGMLLGAGVAVGLRIVFTLIIASLLATPFLKLVGGILLLWIAVKLVTDESGEGDVKTSERLWDAVRTVAIADAVMSLDNVLAIAAIAQDSMWLLIFGLVVSIPLIVAGATLIMKLLDRFRFLVWAGAGLLGWIAIQMILDDPVVVGRVGSGFVESYELPLAAAGAAAVMLVGLILRRRAAHGTLAP